MVRVLARAILRDTTRDQRFQPVGMENKCCRFHGICGVRSNAICDLKTLASAVHLVFVTADYKVYARGHPVFGREYRMLSSVLIVLKVHHPLYRG